MLVSGRVFHRWRFHGLMYMSPFSQGTLTGACRPLLKHLAKGCRRSALRKRRAPPVPLVPFSGTVLRKTSRRHPQGGIHQTFGEFATLQKWTPVISYKSGTISLHLDGVITSITYL